MRKKGFMTIGYGNMSIGELVTCIKSSRVNCIVDVRTKPYSKYNLAFNKEELRERLNDEGISYFWFGNKLGGNYDKIKYCDEMGRVDYEKVALSEKFIDGIKELEKLISRYNVCVMCSEKEPMRCHRFLLIARALKEYNIYHIMPDGSLLSNMSLEKKMLNMYGNLNQLSLFDGENEESFEVRAYREHGRRTAYVSEKVKDLLAQGIKEDSPDKVRVYCIGCNGKKAREFFELLKDYKVKRVIDVRKLGVSEAPFAMYPDIVYYLKTHGIAYEKNGCLIPSIEAESLKTDKSFAKFFNEYAKQINSNNGILSLLSDELDGTCFLGIDEDYEKCYRHVIIRELKKKNPNIVVRHLR